MRQRGDAEQALVAFRAAAAINPDNYNIQVEVARTLILLDQLAEADMTINGILTAEPNQIGALIERGHLMRRRGEHEAAADAFKTASHLDPKNHHIKVELVRDLRRLDRLDEADIIVVQVLDAEPRHVGALVEYGHILRRRSDHDRAASAFQTATEVDPFSHDLKVELARELKALNHVEGSEAILNEVLRSKANHFGALFELVEIYRRRDNSTAILALLETASNSAPTNFDVRTALADEYSRHGKSEEAFAVIREILASKPNFLPALLRLGRLNRWSGDVQASLNALNKALELDRNSTAVLVELAWANWAAGEPRLARQHLAAALKSDPTDLGAIITSAELALFVGETQSALDHAQRAITLHPTQVGPYLLAARAAAEILDRNAAECA